MLKYQLMREDGWPRSHETAELARRMAVVRWFHLPSDPLERIPRLTTALADHSRLVLGRSAPGEARVLPGDEGRRMIAGGEVDMERPLWQASLSRHLDAARVLLIESGRGAGHPLFEVSGAAVLMRDAALPMDLEAIGKTLAGSGRCTLSSSRVEALVRRLVWEMGAIVLWETVGDLLGPNPFLPLLAIYEEGYYPLDLAAEHPLLWAPGLS